jgi:hypothetical protein
MTGPQPRYSKEEHACGGTALCEEHEEKMV